jgi:hypothetical protein
MGIESAEMAKHALNAFLATSMAFINEVAAISGAVGADASDVARGLKSEERIGPRAPTSPPATPSQAGPWHATSASSAAWRGTRVSRPRWWKA